MTEGLRSTVNEIIGAIFVIGGLSGNLALKGFNSPELLAVLGGRMIVWGIDKMRTDPDQKQSGERGVLTP